jgi:hypothetical protein
MFRSEFSVVSSNSLIGPKQNRLMISDPLALQYILNSPQFGHGPNAENVMDLILDRNAVVAAKGRFIVTGSFH